MGSDCDEGTGAGDDASGGNDMPDEAKSDAMPGSIDAAVCGVSGTDAAPETEGKRAGEARGCGGTDMGTGAWVAGGAAKSVGGEEGGDEDPDEVGEHRRGVGVSGKLGCVGSAAE